MKIELCNDGVTLHLSVTEAVWLKHIVEDSPKPEDRVVTALPVATPQGMPKKRKFYVRLLSILHSFCSE
jgi:hypothetical protein